MKKLFMLPLLICSAGVLANVTSVPSFASIQTTLISDANTLGISHQRYADAVIKYERFMTKLIAPQGYQDYNIPDIVAFEQLPAVSVIYPNGELLTPELQQSLIEQINHNDTKLANYLGLSVLELYLFLKLHSQSVMEGKLPINNAIAPDDLAPLLEDYVEVVCRADCSNFGMTSNDFYDLLNAMRDHYVRGMYRDIKVISRNHDGSLHDIAMWRKRHDGLIWKLRAATCDDEISCPVEP
ncbi:hypothetical protein [Pseudoalteromonas byunsanensis]|uniref:DUF3828 domain-containing protein n=1 Tax=Pseudoalteromonas byunsanensis TaxID=327939 RepID=A0A1S1N7Q2_9GAMM|nr:hypothetical protein [Pseudoalteromonas byunsanensis]OHU94684.1 hypothetical protein BIW53_14120 [Pseudoalteromonas byunsanensis]